LGIRPPGNELGLDVLQNGFGKKLPPFLPKRNLPLRMPGVVDLNTAGRIGYGSGYLDFQLFPARTGNNPEYRAGAAFVDDGAIERLVKTEIDVIAGGFLFREGRTSETKQQGAGGSGGG
jgi:hypothetical protein